MNRPKMGDKIAWFWNDFDGAGHRIGTVSEIHPDHFIAKSEDITLWLDYEDHLKDGNGWTII